jgi:hypothetical protein
MKNKSLLATVLLSLSLATASQAGDMIDYFGLGVALQDADSPNFDNGTALVLTAGKRLYSDFGVEAEATTSIDKMEGKLHYTDRTIKDDLEFWSFGFYSTYLWKLGNLQVKPRVGLIYRSLESDVDIDSPKFPEPGRVYPSTDIADIGLSAGIGLHYNLGDGYNIYTNYTKFEDDLQHLTFGAEFKF